MPRAEQRWVQLGYSSFRWPAFSEGTPVPRLICSALEACCPAGRLPQVWDAGSLQRIKTLTGHTDAVRTLAVAGNKLFSGSYDGTLRVWDVHTLECLDTLTGHTGPVRTLVTCGNKVFSGSYDKTGAPPPQLHLHPRPMGCSCREGQPFRLSSSPSLPPAWACRSGCPCPPPSPCSVSSPCACCCALAPLPACLQSGCGMPAPTSAWPRWWATPERCVH